jgi:hypothetical protein
VELEDPNYTAHAIKLFELEERIKELTIMETAGTLWMRLI